MRTIYGDELLKGEFKIFEYTVDGKVEKHSHNFLEIFYVLEGKAYHSINNDETLLKAGDFFFIDYEMEHSFSLYKGESMKVINILFKPTFIDKSLVKCKSLKELLENQFIMIDFGLLPYIFFDETGIIKATILRILNEFHEKKIAYLQIIRSMLIEIIVLSMRNYEGLINSEKNIYVEFVITEIMQNYYMPLKLNDFSKQLNVSTAHLSRLFKAHAGLSFTEYLQKFRLKNAYRLLENTKSKISAISEAVGYEDYKFFYKTFKREFGISPLQVRKNTSFQF